MQEPCNQKWDDLLKIFHAIKMDAPDAKEKYDQLKEVAKLDNDMTPRQKEGIIDRCDNCINGAYGNTKTAANMGYWAVGTSTKGQENGKQ